MAQMLRVAPHIAVPGLLTPQVQQVDFEKYVAGKTNLGSDAMDYLYITTINNINSETFVGQQWGTDLAKQTYTMGQIQAPYYRVEAYYEYDVAEQAKFEALSNGVSLPSFLENLAKQGINQRKHQAILYGFDSEKALQQGIVANETIYSMPADSLSKDTLLTYNIPELQRFLADLARKVMDGSFNMTKPVVISSSTRVINYLKTAVVPLTSYLQGGGVDTVAGVYERMVGEWLGVGPIQWVTDNLLMNADSSGTKDVIRLIAPGLDPQESLSEDINQNLVGEFNSIRYNTFYDSAEGLKRYEAPQSLGKYAAKFVYKMTPGVSLRKEAVISTSIKFS